MMPIQSKTTIAIAGFLVGALAATILKRRVQEVQNRPIMYADRALELAEEEARHFNHQYIGTEHMLLGLIREKEGIAAQVLHNAGVEPNQVRAKIEAIVGRGNRPVVGAIHLTGRAKKVLQLAIEEAQRLNHRYLGTEHLLIGLVDEGGGLATDVLKSLGADLKEVRMQTIELLAAKS